MKKMLFLMLFLSVSIIFGEDSSAVFTKYQEDLFRVLGGNENTSSYVFSRIIERRVKERKLIKIEKVRCRIENKRLLNTTSSHKKYNVLFLSVNDCVRQSGLGGKKLNLVSIYVFGRDSFVRYDRLSQGRVVLFSQIALPNKRSLIGYAY